VLNSNPNGAGVYSGFRDVLQLIEDYAPRQYKVNPNSVKNHYSLACPLPWHDDAEHGDHSGSFSVHVDGKVFFCHGCGEGGGSSKLYKLLTGQGEHSPIPKPPKAKATKPKERIPLSGITLSQLADAKGLDLDYLRCDLGWTDARWYGTPAVEIPYRGQSDQLLATRYRVGLTGDRFRWQKDNRPQLYGLHKLAMIKEFRYILIVEGETDYATLDYAGFPVLAVPGASTWDDHWSYYVRGLDVYLWQEPDQGGDTLLAKLLASNITVRVITPPAGAKDATELRAQLGDSDLFRTTMEILMDRARLEIPERPPRFKTSAHELPEGTLEPRKSGYSRDRDQLVHSGLWMMYMADSSEVKRISQETINAIDGVGRCMERSSFQRYVGGICRADVAKAVAGIPCKGLGHERCTWQTLESSWKRKRGTTTDDGHKVNLEKLVNAAYGEARVNVLWLGAATDSYALFNDYRTLLYKRRPIVADLARTFSSPQATAYGWKVGLMLGETADDVSIADTWREIVGELAIVDLQPTDPTATPAEIGLELVCQGKQAIPLLVAAGDLTPEEGLDRLDDCYKKAEYHMRDAKQLGEEIIGEVSASEAPNTKAKGKPLGECDAPPEHPPGSIPCFCNIPGCRLMPKGGPIHWSKLRGKIRDGKLIEMDGGDLLVSPQLAYTMRGGVMAV